MYHALTRMSTLDLVYAIVWMALLSFLNLKKDPEKRDIDGRGGESAGRDLDPDER